MNPREQSSRNVGAPHVFRRLPRCARTDTDRDAREDRLTEALAATLEAAPEVCAVQRRSVFRASPRTGRLTVAAQRWVGASASGFRAGVRTQAGVSTRASGRCRTRAWRRSGNRRRARRRRMFEKFTRLDSAGTPGVGGTGLGLYIARELARALGGWIACQPGQAGQHIRLRPPPPRHRSALASAASERSSSGASSPGRIVQDAPSPAGKYEIAFYCGVCYKGRRGSLISSRRLLLPAGGSRRRWAFRLGQRCFFVCQVAVRGRRVSGSARAAPRDPRGRRSPRSPKGRQQRRRRR